MDKENILPRVTSFIDSLFTAIDKGSLCKGQLWLFPIYLLFVDTLKKYKAVILMTQSMKMNSIGIVCKFIDQLK